MSSILKSLREIGILTIALTAALVVNYAYGQVWNDPACGPTGCNAPAPINVSNTAQTKEGNLDIANPSGTAVLSTERSVIMHNSPQLLLQDTTVGDLDSRIVAANDQIHFQHDENDNPLSPNWQNALVLKNNADAVPAAPDYARFFGQVRASEYCDASGGNCFDHNDVTALPNCGPDRVLKTDSSGNWVCGADAVGGGSPCSTGYVWDGFGCVCSCTSSVVSSCAAQCRGSCFTAETMVLMADGGALPIHEVKLGDKVQGQNGAIHTVLGLDRPLLWEGKNQHLIEINGETAFTTDNHPIMTTEGWKALNPAMAELEAYDQLAGSVGQLEVGDEIVTETGTIVVESIEVLPQEADDRRLYNLLLDGDHTYYANGMLVHGSVPDKDGLYPLAKDHNGEPVE